MPKASNSSSKGTAKKTQPTPAEDLSQSPMAEQILAAQQQKKAEKNKKASSSKAKSSTPEPSKPTATSSGEGAATNAPAAPTPDTNETKSYDPATGLPEQSRPEYSPTPISDSPDRDQDQPDTFDEYNNLQPMSPGSDEGDTLPPTPGNSDLEDNEPVVHSSNTEPPVPRRKKNKRPLPSDSDSDDTVNVPVNIPKKKKKKCKLLETTQFIYEQIMAQLHRDLLGQVREAPQADRDTHREPSRQGPPQQFNHPVPNIAPPVNAPQLPAGNDQYITLSQHLSDAQIASIAQDRYVDISKLATNNPNEIERPMQLITTADGTPAFKPVKDNAKINNLFQYLRLMMIYGIPYLSTNPECGPEFLQYLHTIIEADLRYTWDAVLQYDIEFRRFRQNNPGHSWANPVFHLFSQLQALHNLRSASKNGQSGKPRQSAPGQQESRPIFENFNKGTCFKRDCRYRHACKKCGKRGHNALACKAGRSTQGNNQGNQENGRYRDQGHNQGGQGGNHGGQFYGNGYHQGNY